MEHFSVFSSFLVLLIMNLNILTLELMLLGFISLLLTVSEKPIANICIPKSVGETFLPCSDPSNDNEEAVKCEAQVYIFIYIYIFIFDHIPHSYAFGVKLQEINLVLTI